ncbi:hypothetical protein AVEN_173347-1 [Araneus ventricosus]|uniref:Uncharacterized protein n=1 Tax=Araneus ventricosus TaxID=182803 RepID=A0A4Y2ICB0_ARAVE|nr:hypothetical protein AVEN_173347-1 [Araneus ventricosus]
MNLCIVGHQPQPSTCRWRCHLQGRQSIKLPRTVGDDEAERRGTRCQNDVGFSLTKTKDDDVPSKSLFNDDLLQLYISLSEVRNEAEVKWEILTNKNVEDTSSPEGIPEELEELKNEEEFKNEDSDSMNADRSMYQKCSKALENSESEADRNNMQLCNSRQGWKYGTQNNLFQKR